MGPTNNLIYLFEHLAGVLGKQVDQELREQLGIGYSQYRILMALDWNPRVQQRAIARSLGQTEASISRQIGVLQDKGLLTAQPDPLNRRTHITVPTAQGQQLSEEAAGIIYRAFGPELAVLGPEQTERLHAVLERLHARICQPGKTGACDHQLKL